ncbi:MAG: DNA (cytosine-5-)-methyltransferase [Coprobacillus cateniformis]|uniref:DNA cytosine methyltransferase n=1 Tax=Longibaculum muris TaxID=1796628 RepID=UPI003AB21725|nr:DNA (cytosine-5-)-methyltransferase [Coprobacillus cateniformis]
MKKIRLSTVFSGIGSIEWAMKTLDISHEIVFACDNGDLNIDGLNIEQELSYIKNLSTIDEMKEYEDRLFFNIKKTNFVKKSYLSNYDLDEKRFFQDVRLLDGEKFKDKVDLFVGGSPCQSFSIMGYQRGLDDARGTLFYEYARLVKEIQPKVFIYENVQGLLNHDKKNTWEVISGIFNSLEYNYIPLVLNSKDFGIPQNRNRVFVVGFKNQKYYERFTPPKTKTLKFTLQDFLIESCDEGYFDYNNYKKKAGIVNEKYFLSEKVLKHVMSVGTKNYITKPAIDLKIARPLLATMHKMHRAGVDNYVTVDGRIRRLTPRECLRLMGYGDKFKQNVSDTQMYKQAGNSIVVQIFESLVTEIIKTGVFDET